ncbi:MAG: hypothetical protein F4213_13275 [Boseongicola sp. SB0677_bin_26]|nr:hypothetical protein [Boseongicola sp. SB0677_bin_26]
MAHHDILSKLAALLRHPVAVGATGGLAVGFLVLAVLFWRDAGHRHWEPDAEEMAATMARIRAGGTGTVSSPGGDVTVTMGLGQTPGVADPGDAGWFWQQIDGLDAHACESIARSLLERPDVPSLRVGPVLVSARAPDALPGACAAHGTVSVVLNFGETL